MIHIGEFEGIGGFGVAAASMGWKTYATCEIAEFPRRVLKYYWPDAYHHKDIHDFTYETIDAELSRRYGTNWRCEPIILTGGFPCQPYSQAGKRLGKEDDRHLWPQMLRTIREIQPEWVVGENVRGLVNWNGGLVFDEVQTDLEAEGYEVQPFLLPACGVNAPHRRDRIWFVAYNSDAGIKNMRSKRENSIYEFEPSPHTNINGRSGQGLETDDQRQAGHGREERSKPATHSEERATTGDVRSVADTESKRQSSQQTWSAEFQPSERSALHGRGCDRHDATDTSNKGLQGSEKQRSTGECGKEPDQQFAGCIQSGWEDFPTQSPVRHGDDGFSDRLVDITFPKWRNESIKALGNAVVPPLVYEIFKAIDKYEKLQ